jgi:4-amino-4-deoxy-L-arabinose transferase-like glycosyltransferase
MAPLLRWLKAEWPILAILALALAVRVGGLSSNPPGLFRDEARKAYSTYSLLETGRDLTGRVWPLQIKEFTAYTTPFYHWFSLPFIGLLGVTVLSTRLLAALAGTVAVFGVYLLGKEWSGRAAGCWCALLLALSPWHLLFSRWANQGILMTAFIPLAVWFAWKACDGMKSTSGIPWKWALPASLFWALSWNAYEPARLFVPLLLAALIAIVACQIEERARRISLLIGIGLGTLVLIAPFVVDIFAKWSETQARLAAIAGDRPFSPVVFVGNYLLHWNPLYLFWTGDANPRHHIGGQGQLTVLEGAASLLGLVALWKGSGAWRGWLLAWLLLAPVPAAITHEGLPHALRTLMVVPALALLGGIGMNAAAQWAPSEWKKRTLAGGLCLVALQGAVTLYLFFGVYPEKSAAFWEKGYLEAIRTVEASRRPGEVCVVSGMIEFPEAAVQFATLPDPDDVQAAKPLAEYRFEETGRPLNPLKYPEATLFLIRPGEARVPPWWKEVPPGPNEEAMLFGWRLYRSERKVSGPQGLPLQPPSR